MSLIEIWQKSEKYPIGFSELGDLPAPISEAIMLCSRLSHKIQNDKQENELEKQKRELGKIRKGK